jgi:hypothetical protein
MSLIKQELFQDLSTKQNLITLNHSSILQNEQYKQVSDDLSKVFLNNQNELFSKYNKRFNRQVYELQSMADQKLSAAYVSTGKSIKYLLNSRINTILFIVKLQKTILKRMNQLNIN